MAKHPPSGTAPIRCGRTRCKWRGFEADLQEFECCAMGGESCSCSVCPVCGYDSYSFLTPSEIAAWEQAQRAAQAAKGE